MSLRKNSISEWIAEPAAFILLGSLIGWIGTTSSFLGLSLQLVFTATAAFGIYDLRVRKPDQLFRLHIFPALEHLVFKIRKIEVY